MADNERTRFRVVLYKNDADALERLRQLCGHASLRETVAKALFMYGINSEVWDMDDTDADVAPTQTSKGE